MLVELIDDHGAISILDEILDILEEKADSDADAEAISVLDRALNKVDRLGAFGGEEGPDEEEDAAEEVEEEEEEDE